MNTTRYYNKMSWTSLSVNQHDIRTVICLDGFYELIREWMAASFCNNSFAVEILRYTVNVMRHRRQK